MRLRDFKKLPVGTRFRLVPWVDAIRRRNKLGLPRLEKIGGVSRETWDMWVRLEINNPANRWIKTIDDKDNYLDRCSYIIPYYALDVDKEQPKLKEEN